MSCCMQLLSNHLSIFTYEDFLQMWWHVITIHIEVGCVVLPEKWVYFHEDGYSTGGLEYHEWSNYVRIVL